MKTLNNLRYKPVNRCIYCGRKDDLGKEHILPFGLSGTAVLPKSSCRLCEAITGEAEQSVLRGFMWGLRVYLGLQSRTGHTDAPKDYPLTVVRDELEQVVMLPIKEYPILLHFPIFAPPAYLNPGKYSKGIEMTGTASISFGPRPEEVAAKLGAKTIRMAQTHEPTAFARMIAKIAYAWAVAEGKLDLDQGIPPVVESILGKSDEIGRWVGTLTEPLMKFPGNLHRILLHEDLVQNLLIGEVQLFSNSPTPRYGVILRKLH